MVEQRIFENHLWQGYRYDTPGKAVLDAFMQKYGYPPTAVFDAGPIILAGPIKEANDGQHDDHERAVGDGADEALRL